MAFLPANMTHRLQPMDLVVNDPLKAKLRSMRVELSLDYFREFKAQYYEPQAKARGKERPKFKPPAPLIVDGLRSLFEIQKGLFREGTFIDNLRK